MEDKPFGCVNNTIKLRSGKYINLVDPQADQIDFLDIAGALSKICRFGGQCQEFYSVAEHCYHCAAVAKKDGQPDSIVLACLLHDGAEAYLGDVVKPLKIMLPEYQKVEWLMEQAIALKFGVNLEATHAAMKEIDRAMLIAERRAMFSTDHILWNGENEVRTLDVSFSKWCPQTAEFWFTHFARSLGVEV